jgi:LysM repeat protein
LHALRHGKKVRDKSLKGKLASRAGACLSGFQMPDCQPMHRIAVASLTLLSALMFGATASPQSFPGNDKSEKMLEALNKKIDEQNAKIDTLSQQILKLEQQISKNTRPGVIIGETPSPSPSPSQPATTGTTEAVKSAPQSGNSHVVAKGETLTSIAKMHKVTVEELQKFNHIENDRKLQIGQTIMIPQPASSPGASPSPSG